jgi:hypothetical protein
VYFTLKCATLKRARLLRAISAVVLMAACSPALAETAYIAQVASRSSGSAPMAAAQPIQMVPTTQPAARSMSFVPTPEMAAPARNGNFAQTIQVGNSNQVFQAQAGGNNVSNVGVWGGKNNDVGVFQGGGDRSNVNLINTQGLAVAVIQPPGAPPLNVLVARLPDGRLFIKR